jgi:CP family cyanate transporter-like MFS transporter
MPLRLVLLWFAGADLRLTLLAVPPLLPLIHRSLGLSESGVAALTNVPVLLLGIAAIPGSFLIARFGPRRALVAALAIVGFAASLRGAGSSAPVLFAMTALMGLGIALAQPALPTLTRDWFPQRISAVTGLWANGLLVGEALAASLTLPVLLPIFGGAWGPALDVWGAVPILTAIGFALLPRVDAPAIPTIARWLPDFRNPISWQLGFFQSAASLTYFGANTFVPDYLHAVGKPELVAACISALNVAQIPASLAIGLIPFPMLARRGVPIAVALAMLGALLALRFGGAAGAIAGSAMLGFCAAYVLVFSFALPALLASGADVARLSAATFTIGYTTSFFTTLLAGAAWDALHEPALAFVPVVAAALIVAGLGIVLARAALHSPHYKNPSAA